MMAMGFMRASDSALQQRLLVLITLWTRFLVCTSSSSVDATSTTTTSNDKIWLPGATGSGPYDVANAWATAFMAKYPEAQVTLSSVGSGAAQTALWGDIDCDKKPVEALCGDDATAAGIVNGTVTETLWGVGDAPIKSAAYEDQPALELQQLPACAGAVAVVYSKEVTAGNDEELESYQPLRLSFGVLAGIFNTSIVYWDDTNIQRLNPTLVLPHERISKVVRLDSSGQTSILTDALGHQVPTWPEEAVGSAPEWPLGILASPSDLLQVASCPELPSLASDNESYNSTTNLTLSLTTNQTGRPYSFAADGKNGISLGLMRVPYSIGYMEMGFLARLADFLHQVYLPTSVDQEYVQASPDTLRTSMAGLANQIDPVTMELNLARKDPPPGGYPVAGFAYWYLKKTPDAYTSCYQAWLLCQFVTWSYQDPQAAQIALTNGWVVPPPAVVNQTLERLQQVMCYDTEVIPTQIISALSYIPPPYRTTTEVPVLLITVTTVAVGLIGLIAAGWMLDRHYKQRSRDNMWKIPTKELVFADPPEVIGTGKFGEVLMAEYRGTQVAVKRVKPIKVTTSLTKGDATNKHSSVHDSMLSLTDMMDKQQRGKTSTLHSTLSLSTSIVRSNHDKSGCTVTLASGSLISGNGLHSKLFASNNKTNSSSSDNQNLRKRKQDLVKEIRFLSNLRHPCVTTVMGAVMGSDPMLVMEYMHHGSLYDLLHNETMMLEGDIAMQFLRDITSGIRFLHSATPQLIHGDIKSMNILVDNKFHAKVTDFGLSFKNNHGTGTPFWMAPELLRGASGNTAASDCYSLGIVIWEVFARRDPYEDDKESFEEILIKIADPSVKKRPPAPRTMPDKIKALMTDCLEDEPDKRPTIEELDTRLKRIDAESTNIVQPGHRNTVQLSLFDIFPRHIAEALQQGKTVDPEHKDCVTIFFSDIVGFTTMASELEPKKVADLLDRLYTKFDKLSHEHDLFKVETIGDAYMAVTNLVKDQEKDHARRIAEFAIDAIAAANSTYIDTDDHSRGFVNIRVGFHSGPVVADVVGTRNPRYCLFGDSVNTASRMESHSEANRINCSEPTALLLRTQYPELPMKSRGRIDIKGKGKMKCYWVNEEGRGPSVKMNLEPLDEASREFSTDFSNDFDVSSEFGDRSQPLSRRSSKFRGSHNSGREGRRQSLRKEHDVTVESGDQDFTRRNSRSRTNQNTGGERRESVQAFDEWEDEETAILSSPEAPLQKSGTLAKIFDKSQKWLRLNEEVVRTYEDEVSV